MTAHNEHGGGEENLRREIIEAQAEEDARAERARARLRTLLAALRPEATDGP